MSHPDDALANRVLVETAIAAFLRGDQAAVLTALDPGVEVQFHGPAELAIAGRYRGHAGFLDYLGRVLGRIQMLEFTPEAFIAEGPRVVVLGSTHARALATGREARIAWTLAFEIAAGRIARYSVYEDTATLMGILGIGDATAGQADTTAELAATATRN